MEEEGMLKTANKLIHIGKPIPFDIRYFLKQLEELAEASYENSRDIVLMVEDIVPTFHPAGQKTEYRNVNNIQKIGMGEAAATAMIVSR